jgi:hypothetical protein
LQLEPPVQEGQIVVASMMVLLQEGQIVVASMMVLLQEVLMELLGQKLLTDRSQ